jgi:UDP-N-acetyl-D-galactosamine dehydrogenase
MNLPCRPPCNAAHKINLQGYQPPVILAGWRIKGRMSKFVAAQIIKRAKVKVTSVTFKEDCGDLRSSKGINIIKDLQSYGMSVHVTAPTANPEEAMYEYGVTLKRLDDLPRADAAVAHRECQFRSVEDLGKKMVKGGAFIDAKAAFDPAAMTGAGYKLWRL